MEVPVYWGHAARPFAIDSPAARFRVLAVPLLLDAVTHRDGVVVVERARQLVAATRFEEVELGVLGAAGTALQLASTLFSDDDGEARRDWKDLITATVLTALGVGLVWFSIAVLPGLR